MFLVSFFKAFHVICSNELQLKFEHRGLQATFLDLGVTIVDYEYKLYMPDLSRAYVFNIPGYVFLGVYSIRMS